MDPRERRCPAAHMEGLHLHPQDPAAVQKDNLHLRLLILLEVHAVVPVRRRRLLALLGARREALALRLLVQMAETLLH